MNVPKHGLPVRTCLGNDRLQKVGQQRCGCRDQQRMVAGAAQSLSILARDMYLPEAIGLISRAAKAIEWPNDLSLQHVQVLRLLGWAKAMHGDYISAIRQIAGASRIADTALTSLLTALDHAWVAAISQQHFLRDAALADAAEHLSADISSPLGDDAAALVLAAGMPIPKARASSHAS